MKIKETILNYDINKYDFKKIVSQLYISDLHKIHNGSDDDYDVVKGLGRDSDTVFHTLFYNKLREGWPELTDLYRKFVREQIFPLIGEDELIFQKTPTYRIDLPINKVTSVWHRDGDELHQHPPGEINFLVPLTKAYDTNTIWTESEPDLLDFHPANMEYGEYLMFNGNECLHGNKLNATGETRVSFDFRVIPGSEYNPDYKPKTVTKGLEYKVGSYYDIMRK
jgi:ectoine hydroxylase-related dioxygenase (phytanoyl-CoA dioxygenase family)